MPENENNDKQSAEIVASPWGLLGLLLRNSQLQQMIAWPAIFIGTWVYVFVPQIDKIQSRDEVIRTLTEQLNIHMLELKQLGTDQGEISSHLEKTAEILDRITARQLGSSTTLGQ